MTPGRRARTCRFVSPDTLPALEPVGSPVRGFGLDLSSEVPAFRGAVGRRFGAFTLPLACWPKGPVGPKCLCGFTTLPGLWESTAYHVKELYID